MRRIASRWLHSPRSLPILVLGIHSRCNCRCLMCDIWRANRNRREIGAETLERHVDALRRLRVRWIVLTGGEPLMHSDLWSVTRLLREELGVRLTLLSTGILLERHADDVVREVDEVVISVDGPPDVHDAIRRVPGAWERLARGVDRLRELDGRFPVIGRSVLQQANFRSMVATVDAVRELGLDRLSFLLVDTGTEAFDRPGGWETERADGVGFGPDDLDALDEIVEALIRTRPEAFEEGFLAESREKLRTLVAHARALAGKGSAPRQPCDAPWVSAAIEPDGQVRPCFFHPPFGSLADGPLDELLRSPAAVAFRRRLDVDRDPVCQRCTCRLRLPPWAAPA